MIDDTPRPVHVLLCEDSPTDADLTLLALEDAQVQVDLEIVTDGEEAMAYLRKEGPYANAKRPDVVLLDLNMPRKSGREVLNDMRSDDRLKLIPVVVLTTSDAEEDIRDAYLLHANAYVAKPVDFDQFIKVVKAIDSFWFTVAKMAR